MERERCWTLVGTYEDGTWHAAKRRRISGKPASVEVDWEWTLKREEKRGDVIGFAHTHPNGAGTTPSERDLRTLRAWRIALGKPLLMLIEDGETIAGYMLHHDDDELKPIMSITRGEQGVFIISNGLS
ncbi:hypothetical protein GPROT1_00913 [Gammaproteobacteria bacterium]|nr:hypothetical protein GPROT1_00913 [Gammaproteobacteria bacterium]